MAAERPWVLLCKPVRAPFRDGTSVLVRNLLRQLPAEVATVYFGDPAAPVRPRGDRVVRAIAMAYQPSLVDKVKMLGKLMAPGMTRLPIHSFFAPNRASAHALDLLRRLPRRRPVLQTLPASTGVGSVAHVLARFDRVVVTSEWGRAQLLAARVAENRVVVVYPGVEVHDEPPGAPLGERRSVLFAGDLDDEVGARLLDVAAALRGAEGWCLEIATRPKGDRYAQVRARLQAELDDAIAAGRVRMVDEVHDMNELYDRAALQLYLASHARRKVDIPFVLLEGMARGVPVAVVDRPPVSELLSVADDAGLPIGLRLDPGRFREAADAIAAAAADPASLQRASAGALALTRSRFSAQEMAARYRGLYEELS